MDESKMMIQKDILARLAKDGRATFTKTSFIQAVNRGTIPYHSLAGAKKKYYDYAEVSKALKVSGIGKPVSTHDKINKLPDPKAGQTQEEFMDEIKELDSSATITEANIYKTIYQGKMVKNEYDLQQGNLILRAEVENKAFIASRAIRDKILTQPERLANELATMTNAHEIKEFLYKESLSMLNGFSQDSFV